MAVVAALAALCFLTGLRLGQFMSDSDARTAHAAGACIALEMAAVHVAIDDVGARRTLRSLTSALNPYRDRFPPAHAGMLRICEAVRDHRNSVGLPGG